MIKLREKWLSSTSVLYRTVQSVFTFTSAFFIRSIPDQCHSHFNFHFASSTFKRPSPHRHRITLRAFITVNTKISTTIINSNQTTSPVSTTDVSSICKLFVLLLFTAPEQFPYVKYSFQSTVVLCHFSPLFVFF